MAAEQVRVPKGMTTQEFPEAVRTGVHDALREMMSGGTSARGADFYAAIQAGVEVAMKAVAREREATTGSTRQEAEPSAGVPARQMQGPGGIFLLI